ncbi:MAG: hypothetical protein GY928_20730 [Colwellia sp.]|nr:hypothetical protein [Colwellia sp.]
MTKKDIRKLFKNNCGVLPKGETQYKIIKLVYKECQAKSNYYLNQKRQEEKIREKFNVYCEAWGVK